MFDLMYPVRAGRRRFSRCRQARLCSTGGRGGDAGETTTCHQDRAQSRKDHVLCNGGATNGDALRVLHEHRHVRFARLTIFPELFRQPAGRPHRRVMSPDWPQPPFFSLSHPDQDIPRIVLPPKLAKGCMPELDVQFVAGNSVVTNLFTAGPRLVPRNVHVDDDLISLSSIFPRIGEH